MCEQALLLKESGGEAGSNLLTFKGWKVGLPLHMQRVSRPL